MTDTPAGGQAPSKTETGPIVVAVDFSADSEAALVWASDYADCTGAPLLVLHVVHDPAEAPGYYRKDEADWARPMAALAEDMMHDFMKEMRTAHPDHAPIQTAETALVTGLPAGRIVEKAGQVKAPLIVVGSRGRTGLPHILLGSVAERISQLAPIPVVLVKAQSRNEGKAS